MDKVKILGNGTVGTSLAKAMGIEALGKSDEPVEAEVVIICVPTETIKGVHDQSQITQAMSRIKSADLIIIRSTVLPGTTDKLQAETDIPIMFIPEFGFEKTMYEDMKNPYAYVAGYTKRSYPIIPKAMHLLPLAQHWYHLPAVDAEFVKYTCNIWGAVQIVLANSLFDWLKAKGGNWDNVIEGIQAHPNLPRWGWIVDDQGGRGASGKCLPKDLKAAISDEQLTGNARTFLENVDAINDDYIVSSGKDKELPEMWANYLNHETESV